MAYARGAPVLVAIDDVQGLDQAFAAALEFACRRLRDERVLLLLTELTEDDGPPDPLSSALGDHRRHMIGVGSLTVAAIYQMLRSHVGRSFARSDLHRMWETSAGNPFHALELAHALDRLEGPMAPGEPLPVPPDDS